MEVGAKLDGYRLGVGITAVHCPGRVGRQV
jgi:hypothetical protein